MPKWSMAWSSIAYRTLAACDIDYVLFAIPALYPCFVSFDFAKQPDSFYTGSSKQNHTV